MKNPIGRVPAFIALLCLATVCSAQEKAKHKQGTEIPAHQWEVVDIQFEVDKLPNAATDVEFMTTFVHSSGTELKVPGFYNGGNEYIVRFTPPKAGDWKYSTRSSVDSLADKNGTVGVNEVRKGRKGGIVLDPFESRLFLYENGERYYPIAFESDWLFALDADNENDIPKTKQLVDTLAKNGFNQIVLNVFAYDVNWAKDKRLKPEHDYGSPRVFPFGGDNTTPDHSELNIEYFKRFDRVVEYLDKKGIAAHVMVYVWNKRVNWPKANSIEDNRYFDYVVKRYQAYPNMVWDISKEALGYGHNDVNYITDRIERLRKLDAYKRLVTVHDYSYCRRFAKHVDFISVQIWASELYSTMRKIRDDFKGQPVLNIEHGGYEESPYVVFQGDYTSAETCLERAYQCVFAGTYPSHYWQGAAWNVVIPDVDSLPEDRRPKLEYFRHMSELIDRYEIGDLVSGQKRSSSGFNLNNAKDTLVYYVPKENDFMGVRIPKEWTGDVMQVTWFDPFTGKYAEPYEVKLTQWPKITKPKSDRFAIAIVKVKTKKDQK